MHEIDAALPADDGVAVFNRMYLTVTESIAAILAKPAGHATFLNPEVMADLDVTFANLWLAAYDAGATAHTVPIEWRSLFELRDQGRLPVQYAIAGMNTHIEHDLPVAVVATCTTHNLEPSDLHHDYDAVNGVLAQVEAPIRQSFLDGLEREVDDRVGAVVHLISTWDIDKAREIAWVTAETLWELRRTEFLRDRFIDGLADTVGMATRALLVPIP
ncbi:MAG: hypothetical protein JWQ32_1100 [Marmoricola sp.]|nr:hypothetical protein [Marmoricola sp.]